jgi:hypothetical protein
MKCRCLLMCCLFSFFTVEAAQRASSAPYISGDSFRFASDFAYDDISKELDPGQVFEGSTVFVKTDYLDEYFHSIHPKITVPYILITHNSDDPIPGPYSHMLDDKKIIAWFGQNVENYSHPKLHPIPIGVANQCWKHGDIKILEQMQKLVDLQNRNIMLYMNFSLDTNKPVREFVFKKFKKKKYCFAAPPKSFTKYLTDINRSKFVLSPRGNGLDCHRTWEALYMGAIPVVKSSAIDPLFDDLPVLIIKRWGDIKLSFLKLKHKEILSQQINKDKLYIDYWMALIHSFKP